MKALLKYLKDYKVECVLAPLFKMLEASFELLVPLVMAAIIDTGIANQEKSYIYRMCGVLILLGLVGLVSSVTAQYFSAKAAVGFAAKLRHALFGHLQTLSYTEIDTLGTSTMITRMTSDVNQTQTGVNMFLRLFLRSPFVVFGAMVMAFTIDVKSAMYFVIAIVLLSIVVFGIMALNIPMLKRVQQRLDQVLSLTRENLTGVRVIRAFCKEGDEIARFCERNQELTKQQKKAGSISGLLNPVTYVIINLAIIGLIYTGAIQVDHGILTQGQVVALYNYMSQILVELIKLANLIVTLNKAAACGNRIAAVFDVTSSMSFPENDRLTKEVEGQEQKITFRHVDLTYHEAGSESLHDISFSVKKGQTLGIIGGTGSGKTSVVQLIPRFYDVTNGEVLIDGINVKNYTENTLRSKVGMVLQKAVLFQGTIADNLRWGKADATEEELEQAITIAQAEDVVAAKGGLQGMIEQNGRNLSGGQKQRLTIARALVKQPEILILDDSASALDMATDARLRKAIRTLSYHPTVIIVSQRTAAIQDADAVLVLEDGEAVGYGTHQELLKSCEIYQEIYESQYRKEA